MDLPVRPPVAPMLAKLARALPAGDHWRFEPKWDGFRCLVFRDGDEVDLRSRNDRPLARYFPELVEAVRALAAADAVLDGEILVVAPEGVDFAALLLRLHPAASRVERLRRETPASFVAFDLLALDGHDLRSQPFAERRAALERLLHGAPRPLLVTPSVTERAVAEAWLERFRGGGLDGVVAKDADAPYEPGRRSMVKVKPDRTADCVLGGFRWWSGQPLVGALLLGVHDEAGALRHVGVVTSLRRGERAQLTEALAPYAAPLAGHPWEQGFGLGRSPVGRLQGAAGRWTPDMALDWVPVRPELVCEVAYDQLKEGRFRHPARFRRWRPDRDPRSCTFDQFEAPDPAALHDALGRR